MHTIELSFAPAMLVSKLGSMLTAAVNGDWGDDEEGECSAEQYRHLASERANNAADAMNASARGAATASGSSNSSKPASSKESDAQNDSFVAIPARENTPHWFLREEWTAFWGGADSIGPSSNALVPKMEENAAYTLLHGCTGGGQQAAASHYALPNASHFRTSIAQMNMQERAVLALSVVADSIRQVRLGLAKVITDEAPCEINEFIGSQLLRESEPARAGQHSSGSQSSDAPSLSMSSASSGHVPSDLASSNDNAATSSLGLGSRVQELKTRILVRVPRSWRAAAARHVWGHLGAHLESLRKSAMQAAEWAGLHMSAS